MLYWTDRNSARPAIYRSSVINPARVTVVSTGLHQPTALAVDFSGILTLYNSFPLASWINNSAGKFYRLGLHFAGHGAAQFIYGL